MKLSDFRIRDPFVLVDGGKYYLYGTTRFPDGDICENPRGFDVYVSSDLEDFEGPYPVFEADEKFIGRRDFWAPEVYKYDQAYYMLATIMREKYHGVVILRAESPLGPFRLHSDIPITPREWSALDGTLYIDEQGAPYMVFCHEWWQIGDGTMCYARLSDDLTRFISEPKVMFSASTNPFGRPSKLPSGGLGYITDGPCMYKTRRGELLMLWSMKGENGYMECVYRSENGKLSGLFTPVSVLFPEDGGHGMIFKTLCGEEKLVLHTPNTRGEERAKIFELADLGDKLKIV